MIASLATLLVIGCQNPAVTTQTPPQQTIYEFKMKDIDGKDVSLEKFKGKVLLVVNVASKCGLTPQYKGLEALYREKKDEGLVVLGFPANDFRGQEPGTEAEIKEFCSTTYDVTFPMFSKITVLGESKHALYAWLLANSDRKEEIEWNFGKFLIGKDGKVKARFSPRQTVSDAEVQKAINEALKA